MSQKTIVIIGGGPNGLVITARLAKEGHKVTLLEAREQVGGAAYTDNTTFPGFKISKFSYVNALFRPEIVRELELERRGYEILEREPSSVTLLPDGRSLLLGKDMKFNQAQIAQFSPRDAAVYPRYEEELAELGKWADQIMLMIPPSGPWPRNWRDVRALLRLGHHTLHLNPAQMRRLKKLLFTDPVKYLDGWFESDELKATLLPDGLIGAVKLSGYVFLHHVMRGSWGYMRGGMGSISNALAAACTEYGAEIVCNARAQRIVLDPRTNAVRGVWVHMQNGPTFFPADIVVSAVNPTITFTKLLPEMHALEGIRKRVVARDCKSGTMKINLALRGLPNFKAIPGTAPGPQHRGTIHIAPTVAYILTALRDYHEGRSSAHPILEITIPSVVDDTLAPKAGHVMGIFLQFVDWNVDKEAYWRDAVLPLLRQYISNIDEIIIGVQILAPQDIERELGMIGGNIFHGAMGFPEGLLCNRPAPGIADYRIPGIKGLYLSGAGMPPGGGVSGAPGDNTARVILEDLGM